MIYLDVNNIRVVSLQHSATGLSQGFCQLPPREESLKVFCKLKVLNTIKLKQHCYVGVISE